MHLHKQVELVVFVAEVVVYLPTDKLLYRVSIVLLSWYLWGLFWGKIIVILAVLCYD